MNKYKGSKQLNTHNYFFIMFLSVFFNNNFFPFSKDWYCWKNRGRKIFHITSLVPYIGTSRWFDHHWRGKCLSTTIGNITTQYQYNSTGMGNHNSSADQLQAALSLGWSVKSLLKCLLKTKNILAQLKNFASN